MKRLFIYHSVAAWAFLSAGQAQPQPAQDPAFRATARLVQVNVIVENRQGAPVGVSVAKTASRFEINTLRAGWSWPTERRYAMLQRLLRIPIRRFNPGRSPRVSPQSRRHRP
jgi:hypothetical protein